MGGVEIDDNDKNAWMATVHKLDRKKGLDLLLHTPGGQVAATESIVDYLKQIFGDDIIAIVPQIAMSAGTMMACACKSIIMGKQSNLGPIDPQFNGLPAAGVVEEFKRAIREIKRHPERIPLWQVVVGKYHPTFLGECENAILWSKQIVSEWLEQGMLSGTKQPRQTARKITNGLSSRKDMKNHSRHISREQCQKIGLKIEKLESDQELQDLVLTVHHAYMHTFSNSLAIKIVENHLGAAVVNSART